jgi:Bacterial Ig domain/IPT/TIG domain
VTVPAGATTGNVVVTVGGLASNGVGFTVTTPAPSITSLNPTSGLVGSSVTITGANFGATQGSSTVQFNGTAATATSWSATSIGVTVPAGATTGNVVVTVGGASSNGVSFTVTTPAPSITSLNPTSGLVGSAVTISGANFGATQGTSTVKFNGTAATATSWSATSIGVTVPTGATTGNVVVTVSGVASNGVSFAITAPAPSITSLSPTSGVLGALVTITGANFGATQGTSTVKFNGTAATATIWSAASIVAVVPAGATTGNVVVTVGGAASNGVSFAISVDTTPPVVTVTAPANNATVSGTITLTATATDPDSPVSFVQFQVDGANFGGQLTTAPYSLSLNTTTLSNATHTISAVAQDPSGNVGTSATVTITVSNSSSGQPTLIYSTAVPLAVPSGSAWGGASPCGQNVVCYRIPLPEPTVAGTTLVMAFGYDSTGSNQVFSVTDNKSNTWALDVTSAASNNKTMRMYRASNVAAGTTAINVQLNSGSQNGYWNALIGEFYNVGTLDGSSCSAGSSASISAGNISPAQSGDLIFQAKYSASLTKQTSSFTQGLQPNITWSLASQLLGDGAADQYGVYASTVPVNPTFTQAASDSYISCAVALTAASSGSASTTIPRVVHQEHDAMPKSAANPWHVGLVVDVPNSAVYLSYVGNDSISSVSSVPAPNVGWTPSGADFQGLNGHNHVNYYCAQWTTPPGAVTLSINRSANSNDSINMIYVVQNGTCNLDADSGGQAGSQGSIGPLTTCSNCLTPTKPNDFIMGNGGQAFCTATGLNSPSGGIFDSAWFTGNTIDGPTQTDENNFWMHFTNGSSLSSFTVTFAESCDFSQSDWAGRIAAYQTN